MLVDGEYKYTLAMTSIFLVKPHYYSIQQGNLG